MRNGWDVLMACLIFPGGLVLLVVLIKAGVIK